MGSRQDSCEKGNKPGIRLIKSVLAVLLYDFRLLIPAVLLVNYRKDEMFVLSGSVPTTKLLLGKFSNLSVTNAANTHFCTNPYGPPTPGEAVVALKLLRNSIQA